MLTTQLTHRMAERARLLHKRNVGPSPAPSAGLIEENTCSTPSLSKEVWKVGVCDLGAGALSMAPSLIRSAMRALEANGYSTSCADGRCVGTQRYPKLRAIASLLLTFRLLLPPYVSQSDPYIFGLREEPEPFPDRVGPRDPPRAGSGGALVYGQRLCSSFPFA